MSLKEEISLNLKTKNTKENSLKETPVYNSFAVFGEDFFIAQATSLSSSASQFEALPSAHAGAGGSAPSNNNLTPNGIVEDFRQGGIGDCWFLASIKAISVTSIGQTMLSSTISILPTSCSVSFLGAKSFTYNLSLQALSTEINNTNTYSSTAGHSSGDADTLLLEMAMKNYSGVKSSFFSASMYKGGWMNEALSLLTGKQSSVFLNYSNNLGATTAKLNELAQIKDNTAITAACMNGANPSLGIAASNHAYSIVDINPDTQTVSIRNPWYSSTVLQEISYSNFSKYFQRIDYVDMTTEDLCLYSTSKNSDLLGDSGNDVLYGGVGSNILDGGEGNDTIYGGKGNDSYIVNNTGDIVVEYYNQGTDTVNSSVSYALGYYLENLTLTGTEDLNGAGNGFNNNIKGNDGSNVLYGYEGNDIIDGGAGADIMYGGWGNDKYYVDDADDIILENFNQGVDNVYTKVSYALSNNIENIILSGSDDISATGNSLNNIIHGNNGNNVIDGGAGIDNVDGGLGNDKYYVDNTKDVIFEKVSQGNDSVIAEASYVLSANVENLTLAGSEDLYGYGNSSANHINGNDGNNLLAGRLGNDTLEGGAGNDKYLYNYGDGKDAISDTDGSDTVCFAKTVVQKTIAFFKSGNDLICAYSGNNRIKIQNQFDSNSAVEKFEIYGGKYLTNNDINQVIQQISAYASAKHITLNTIENVTANSALMTIISNSWHA